MENNLITLDNNEYDLTLLNTEQNNLGKKSVSEYLMSLPSETSRKTMASYLRLAATRLGSDIQVFNWGCLRENVILALRSSLAQDHAPASVNTVLAALKGVSRRLWVNNLLSTREYELIIRIKGVRGRRIPKGRALTDDELNSLFEKLYNKGTAKSIRDIAMFSVMAECGLRRAEVTSLEYANIHLDEDMPYLTVIGKGNKERVCYIPDTTIQRLKEWFEIRGDFEGNCFTQVDKYEHVLQKPLDNHRLYAITKEWCSTFKIDDFSPHDMRRTYASHLLSIGVDISTVKDMMGHSNIATTQRYDKRGDERMRNAVAMMNARTK